MKTTNTSIILFIASFIILYRVYFIGSNSEVAIIAKRSTYLYKIISRETLFEPNRSFPPFITAGIAEALLLSLQ